METHKETGRSPSLLIIAFLTFTACLFYALSGAVRCNFGLIRTAVCDATGMNYTSIGFVLAVAQLIFGVVQPLFGLLALNRSNGCVLTIGTVCTAAGLVLIPWSGNMVALMLTLGILVPVGLGAFSFGVLMGAISPVLGKKRSTIASGVVNASNGIGNFIFSPLLQAMLDHFGFTVMSLVLAVPALLLIPLGIWLSHVCAVPAEEGGRAEARQRGEDSRLHIVPLFREAFRDRSYRLLAMAFFTCGFHMAIIETNLYPQIISYGIAAQHAAFSFSIYGIATIIGSVSSGALCSRFPMKIVLGCFFGARPFIIAAALLVPGSVLSMYCFAAALGLTGAATVPPVSGLLARIYGVRKLAALFGMVYISHQIGSFFSTWLGSWSVSLSGGYNLIWTASIVLSALAAIASFCVRESGQ